MRGKVMVKKVSMPFQRGKSGALFSEKV